MSYQKMSKLALIGSILASPLLHAAKLQPNFKKRPEAADFGDDHHRSTKEVVSSARIINDNETEEGEVAACINDCRDNSNDGYCDDGGPGAQFSVCDYGTDCGDCGVRGSFAEEGQLCTNSKAQCKFNADDECDDGGPNSNTSLCPLGTDCADCGVRNNPNIVSEGSYNVTTVQQQWRYICHDTCVYHSSGVCSDGGVGSTSSACPVGTDCNDCGPRLIQTRCENTCDTDSTSPPSSPASSSTFSSSDSSSSFSDEDDSSSSDGSLDDEEEEDVDSSSSDDENSDDSDDEEDSSSSFTQDLDSSSSSIMPFSNGQCDDGRLGAATDLCALGTDCDDCGSRKVEEACFNTCPHAGDDECDDGGPGALTSACERGTDCVDCGRRQVDLTPMPAPTSRPTPVPPRTSSPTLSPTTSMNICFNSCRDANDGYCDDGGPGASYSICDYGTDCGDCGVRTSPNIPTSSPNSPRSPTSSSSKKKALAIGLGVGLPLGTSFCIAFIICMLKYCCGSRPRPTPAPTVPVKTARPQNVQFAPPPPSYLLNTAPYGAPYGTSQPPPYGNSHSYGYGNSHSATDVPSATVAPTPSSPAALTYGPAATATMVTENGCPYSPQESSTRQATGSELFSV